MNALYSHDSHYQAAYVCNYWSISKFHVQKYTNDKKQPQLRYPKGFAIDLK
jgi:hypothetical protein